MKTYIINLEKSLKRKTYIENLFSQHKEVFQLHFINAVDGGIMSKQQLYEVWNQHKAYGIYGRYMKAGEIGCALSHLRCYEEIVKQDDEMALVVEDDMSFQNVNVEKIIRSITELLLSDTYNKRPTIVLLSGDYWYTWRKRIPKTEFQLASVYDAMGAIAHIVNKKAAMMLINQEKSILADDWYNKKTGINLYALYPHIVDTADLGTEISTDGYLGTIRKNLSFSNKMYSYYRAAVRRALGKFGHFEKRVCF